MNVVILDLSCFFLHRFIVFTIQILLIFCYIYTMNDIYEAEFHFWRAIINVIFKKFEFWFVIANMQNWLCILQRCQTHILVLGGIFGYILWFFYVDNHVIIWMETIFFLLLQFVCLWFSFVVLLCCLECAQCDASSWYWIGVVRKDIPRLISVEKRSFFAIKHDVSFSFTIVNHVDWFSNQYSWDKPSLVVRYYSFYIMFDLICCYYINCSHGTPAQVSIQWYLPQVNEWPRLFSPYMYLPLLVFWTRWLPRDLSFHDLKKKIMYF